MLDVIEASQRVEKGAALLDEKIGTHWSERVNFATLHMDSCETCVAAQGTGLTYSETIPVLFATGSGWVDASAYGFALALDDGCDDACDACEQCREAWGLLESAWVGLITVRRSRAKTGA